jgi:hypothetical protein
MRCHLIQWLRAHASGAIGRDGRRRALICKDYVYIAGNQIGYERRLSVSLIVRPAVFDCDVLAVEIAAQLQTLLKRKDQPDGVIA